MALTDNYYAVLEAGGTKFNCAIINAKREIVAQQRIPTTTPEETLHTSLAFYKEQQQAGYAFSSMGIASFGPLDLNPQSPAFGSITKTPKPHWSDTPLRAFFADKLDCDVVIDTDVNAAALAEHRWGAGQGCNVVVYITVGTGVGGGIVVNGHTVRGMVHPEMGHMLVSPASELTGTCPYHSRCVEGLVCGAALKKLYGQPAESFDEGHPAWAHVADVLSQLCHNLMMTLSPEKIIFGGGVMQKASVIDDIIRRTTASVNGYIAFGKGRSLTNVITVPALGTNSGMLGALALLDN